jgi:predicted flap endonuclease-1-like 5' DNA nuclease
MTWSWLSFVVGVLVGWLIEWLIDRFSERRTRSGPEAGAADALALRVQLDEAQARERELEAEISDLRAELEAQHQATGDCTEALEECRAELAAALAAPSVAAKAAPVVVEPQDLTRIEGIGPKIAGLLNEAGILDYAQLAAAPVEHLREILRAAGSRYAMANPASWPQQAGLAAEEKWEELDALQDRLSAGRETG